MSNLAFDGLIVIASLFDNRSRSKVCKRITTDEDM